MLIDFADVLMVGTLLSCSLYGMRNLLTDFVQINVFKLGRTYKVLLEELRVGGNVFLMNPIDPESLIYRFAKQLEFGSSTMQVASEAVRIVQRMSRDWMTIGRRPAGVCGAALILAARMNNFRRTVREVVYVVKVTEITISQRLDEFSTTESGELTVDQFRSVQLENSHDPPSFTRAREGRKPRKNRMAPETAAEIEGDGEEEEEEGEEEEEEEEDAVGHDGRQQQATGSTASSLPKRVDADGFAIPDLPIDPALKATQSQRNSSIDNDVEEDEPGSETDDAEVDEAVSGIAGAALGDAVSSIADAAIDQAVSDIAAENSTASTSNKPKGRPKGSKNKPLPSPTPEQMASEEALENEMEALLSKDSNIFRGADSNINSNNNSNNNGATAAANNNAAANRKDEQQRQPIPDTEEIGDDEFDNDPEVANCLLTPGEVDIKERIWVSDNKDYLRTQQAKALKRALVEADMPPGTVNKPRKRRRGRLGDVTYLEGGSEDGDGGRSTRATTPAEATRRMLERRGFSKKINYRLLESLYGEEKEEEGDDDGDGGSDAGMLVSGRGRSQSVMSRHSDLYDE